MFSASMSNKLPKSSSLFGTSAKYGRCSEIIRASCARNIQAGKKAWTAATTLWYTPQCAHNPPLQAGVNYLEASALLLWPRTSVCSNDQPQMAPNYHQPKNLFSNYNFLDTPFPQKIPIYSSKKQNIQRYRIIDWHIAHHQDIAPQSKNMHAPLSPPPPHSFPLNWNSQSITTLLWFIWRGVRSDVQLSCTGTQFQKGSQSGKNGSKHQMLSISIAYNVISCKK